MNAPAQKIPTTDTSLFEASRDICMTPVMQAFAHDLSSTLIRFDRSCHADIVEARMADLLHRDLVLTADQQTGAKDCYTRHRIYTDPNSLFTILALHWGPGQESPVHGHHAWGTIGILSGQIEVTCYGKTGNGDCLQDLDVTRMITAAAGATTTVCPDPGGIHKMANRSNQSAITLHVYGMDLRQEPTAINKYYS